MAGERLFQTRGPATANALSPSDVSVRKDYLLLFLFLK